MTKQQDDCFEKFKQLKVGALFMKMGTGKTKVAIDLVNYNNVDYLLYITPFSTKSNVEQEIKKWGINCKYDIVGYETLQASDIEFLKVYARLQSGVNFIIADESIFIKNEETKRFKRLLQLRDLCKYALILNGTPITKNEWDLYNQMFFLSPKILNMNRSEFLSTFFKKITYKRKHHNEHTFYKFSEVNAELLKKLIEPYIFECDLIFNKTENTQIKWVDVECKPYYVEKNRKLQEYKETGNGSLIVNMLTQLNYISAIDETKNNKVAEYINNKQVIVYCNFLEEIKYLQNLVRCYVITGGIKNRKEIIEKFRNDKVPLIMTYGVGSYSLNLQFCKEIVYSSINFDYGKVEQSKYRIKRIGQENDIQYTYILSNLGINRLILENLNKKKTLQNLIKEKLEKEKLKWIKNL